MMSILVTKIENYNCLVFIKLKKTKRKYLPVFISFSFAGIEKPALKSAARTKPKKIHIVNLQSKKMNRN